SESTPVMWSSTTTTSSTLPYHCLANMPIVAEPQPTRIRSSILPLITGGVPARAMPVAPALTASPTPPPGRVLVLAGDHRGLAGLDDRGGAGIDRDLPRLAVAEAEQRVAGDAAFF